MTLFLRQTSISLRLTNHPTRVCHVWEVFTTCVFSWPILFAKFRFCTILSAMKMEPVTPGTCHHPVWWLHPLVHRSETALAAWEHLSFKQRTIIFFRRNLLRGLSINPTWYVNSEITVFRYCVFTAFWKDIGANKCRKLCFSTLPYWGDFRSAITKGAGASRAAQHWLRQTARHVHFFDLMARSNKLHKTNIEIQIFFLAFPRKCLTEQLSPGL